MPSKSKQQQKFFGVVKAMQKGDIPKKGEAGEVADDMTKKEVDKMASTKHKGLVNKIKELVEEEIKSLIEAELPDEGFSDPEQMREAKSAKSLKSDYDKAVKKEQALSSLLLVNLEKYKSAKASGDEKAIAKHTKIAADLSKKKSKATTDASAAYKAYEDKISGLHADAELELKEGANANRWFSNLKYYYQKGLGSPDLRDPAEKKAYNKLAKQFFSKLKEGKLTEMDINDPILVAIRARKTMLDKAKAAPKPKKISMNKYYKLMDMESDLIDQMKDVAKELAQLNSDMNAEAGQKGDNWSDADANRYGGDLDKLQSKYEKLAKQKAKAKKAIMTYRIS